MAGENDKPKRSKAICALAQAVIAVPGVAAAAEVQTDYLFSFYQEADVPAANTSSGSAAAERYEIQSHLFRLVSSADRQTYGLNLTVETMSGASPWWIQPKQPGVDERPVVVMSGASITEERLAADASVGFGEKGGRVTVIGGYSTEDDYESVSGGLEFEHTDDRDVVTWTGGARYSSDQLEPTQGAGGPGSVSTTAADKTTASVYGGVAVVLDRRTVFQTGLSYQYNEGFLSDPYKKVWIVSNSNARFETRPEERHAVAATLKLRRHVRSANAAMHIDYRYYRDDWEIDSHTAELAWHQRIAVDWDLAPSVRWYSQTAASFYDAFFRNETADGFASSDYRLAPFGAVSARLDLTWARGPWGLGTGVEYYDAAASYSIAKDERAENPGLVEYMSWQARAYWRF